MRLTLFLVCLTWKVLFDACGVMDEELYCGPALIYGPSPSEWWWMI